MLSTLLLLAAGAAGLAQQATDSVLPAGDYERSLRHDGRTRYYLVHIPPEVEGPLPVVLSFHGGGGSAENHEQNVYWDALADEEGFIAVYPFGTGPFRRRLLTWNAEDCCAYAQENDVDDVGFVRALLDDLAGVANVDESRVYATGFSNGGMFAYRLAAEAADIIAAAAPVGGAALIDSIRATRSVPLMHIHSVDDPRALYDGGLGPPFPLTNRRQFFTAVDTVLAQWLDHNGCPGEPESRVRLEGAAGSFDEGITARQYVYGPCTGGAEVVFWKLTGAGHAWPGGRLHRPRWLVGRPTTIIDANREIWEFFSRFTLESGAR